LSRLRARRFSPSLSSIQTFAGAVSSAFLAGLAPGRVSGVAAFGSNPGGLSMRVYAPPRLRAGRPLVVVLHGCGQDGANFAADAGWLAVAKQFRLALLIPQQSYENNQGRCFNWFRPDDVRRGSGEAMSIRQMVRAAVKRFGSDPRRIYIVGFSAGGAMTAAMLAAYPALFAAGAVVAGFPVGCARTSFGAALSMRQANLWRTRGALANDVRMAGRGRARRKWPRLAIWHGDRDRTVAPGNAEALAAQWSELHGYGPEPSSEIARSGARQRGWGPANRPAAVELWTLAGLGHGFPVDPKTEGGGHPGAWVTDAGVSAAQEIARFWGLERPSP
jgi:poly(hydroxyalkanoate) depolymerase family esterase